MQTVERQGRFLSVNEYASELARNGTPIIPGAPGTFWMKYESGTMMRIPTFHLVPPASDEVQRVLWKGRAAIVSYLREPDESHPANAWLYVCANQTYTLETLAPAMRRNVRRGCKELKVSPLGSQELLAHGVQAFCDTRRRVGLSDGTPENFTQRFSLRARCPNHVFLGAWWGDTLAAFLSISEVNDWAEIEGCFSRDALLHLRPNDTLMFSALSHYLTEKGCCLVSYGLSSVQVESNEVGLHTFKTKVGFDARPVHRAFIPHPFLRPFVNRLVLRGLNEALRFAPGNRRLKKAGGVLACMLGEKDIAKGEIADDGCEQPYSS